VKHILILEAIGDNLYQQLRSHCKMLDGTSAGLGSLTVWVAEIRGPDPRWRWSRRFVRGKRDYRRCNSAGSRGIFISFEMESGRVYEVQARLSWRRSDRYFCRIDAAGDLHELPEEDILKWLPGAETSASTC